MISQFPTIPCKFKRLRLGLEAGAGPGLAKGKCFKTSSFPKTKKTTQTTEHDLTLSLSPEMDVYFVENFKQYNGWYLVVPPWLRKPPYITYRLGPPNIMLVGLKTQWTSSMSLLYPIVIGVMFANLAILNRGPTLYIYIYIHIHHEAKS